MSKSTNILKDGIAFCLKVRIKKTIVTWYDYIELASFDKARVISLGAYEATYGFPKLRAHFEIKTKNCKLSITSRVL